MKKESVLPTPRQLCHIFSAVPHLYTWICGADGTLLESSCPHADIFHQLFCQCDYPRKIADYAKNASAPYALSIYMGLVWYAVLEKQNGSLSRFYLLGPVFQYPPSLQRLDELLRRYETSGMNLRSRRVLLSAMEDLPVIPHTQLASYAILLHYSLTGEKLGYEYLNILPDTPGTENRHFSSSEISGYGSEAFYSGTVRDFQSKEVSVSPSVYRHIRHTEEDFLAHLKLGVPLSTDPQTHHMALLPTDASGIHTPTGKTQMSAAILTALYARAAADAGLSCEESYQLADRYLGQIYQTHSPMGLQRIMGEIVADYTRRVHTLLNPSELTVPYSKEIRLAIDYIRNHICNTVTLSDLAHLTGYSTYYLSRKFRQETGCALPAYIRREKITYAAHLLITTEGSISEITETLGFASRSHFSQDFSRQMGMTPGAYRKKYAK